MNSGYLGESFSQFDVFCSTGSVLCITQDVGLLMEMEMMKFIHKLFLGPSNNIEHWTWLNLF